MLRRGRGFGKFFVKFDNVYTVNFGLNPKEKERYIKNKINMFKEFYIELTEKDIAYLNSLDSKQKIDIACRRILKERL